jgi:hypothetical protein
MAKMHLKNHPVDCLVNYSLLELSQKIIELKLLWKMDLIKIPRFLRNTVNGICLE